MRFPTARQAVSLAAAITAMTMPATVFADNATSTQQPGVTLVHIHGDRAQQPVGDALPSAKEAVTDTSVGVPEAVGPDYANWISHMRLTSADA